MIIIITGTPGTGKTTIGKIIADDNNCRLIESSKLLKKLELTKEDPTGRYTDTITNLEPAIQFILNQLKKEKCVVLETLYPTLWLENESINQNTALILLLRTRPDILYNRLEEKGWPLPKIIENCLAEAFNIIAEELEEYKHDTIEIDTSMTSTEITLEKIYDKIMKWDTGIQIDWTIDPKIADLIPRWSLRLDLDKYRLGL